MTDILGDQTHLLSSSPSNACSPGHGSLISAMKKTFPSYWVMPYICANGIPSGKAIHGAKTKNDKIDAHKIDVLLRGGMIPMAYVYPPQMGSTRDLL
jgi:hypothetical protein